MRSYGEIHPMTGSCGLTLEAGALELQLAPQRGGSISRFDCRGADGGKIPVFQPAVPGTNEILGHGSFPLVPFSNRIRGGRFVFRGRRVALAPNLAGDPSPLHGQAWLAPWEVESTTGALANLAFRHEPGEWPWAYEARQRVALDPVGLTVTLSCTNGSDEAMPCGLGHHPYFPCRPGIRIDTEAECAWTIDEHVLPVEKVPARGRYDLRDRPACGQGLDNGFGGWSGLARIAAPGLPFRILLSSPDARFFQLYSPASGGMFVAEPVSHANAALNEPEERWGELGLRVLEPGETMSLTMRVELIPAQ
jgi:aldose 1-epimerase